MGEEAAKVAWPRALTERGIHPPNLQYNAAKLSLQAVRPQHQWAVRGSSRSSVREPSAASLKSHGRLRARCNRKYELGRLLIKKQLQVICRFNTTGRNNVANTVSDHGT